MNFPGFSSDQSQQMPPNTNFHQLEKLRNFLATAPESFVEGDVIKRFTLPNGDHISCILWNNYHFITGTDIVKILFFRFHLLCKQILNPKKVEEGIFSDLRNLKPGFGSQLEEPKSPFLEFLHRNGCIRTQKKQKVFFWRAVNHDQLFEDALERARKYEKGKRPTEQTGPSSSGMGTRVSCHSALMIPVSSIGAAGVEGGTINPASIMNFPSEANSFGQGYQLQDPGFGFALQPTLPSNQQAYQLQDPKRFAIDEGTPFGSNQMLPSSTDLIDDNLRLYFDADGQLDQYLFGSDTLCSEGGVNSESWQI